jgi:hypothetical protein
MWHVLRLLLGSFAMVAATGCMNSPGSAESTTEYDIVSDVAGDGLSVAGSGICDNATTVCGSWFQIGCCFKPGFDTNLSNIQRMCSKNVIVNGRTVICGQPWQETVCASFACQ